ncbi:MAG: IPT/TIG domain-containing protein [Verrucomicrobiota bacterium]
MDTAASKSTRRKWLAIAVAPLFLALAGCDLQLTNLTPSVIKANPSQVYSVTAQVAVKNGAILEETVRPIIVIDGQHHPMVRVPGSSNQYEYDFPMPSGRNSATYYMLVKYDRKTPRAIISKEVRSELSSFTVEGRYLVELETSRAPVGTRVAILGRGFNPNDRVTVNGVAAPTRYDSSTSISFYVPSLPQGRNYEVKVIGQNGEISAGSMRVDASKITVRPGNLNLQPGGRGVLVFTIPDPAPASGLDVRVTTDVPQSVIMPYVRIEGGQYSTSVSVQGGQPGNGSLFIEVPGYSEIIVPVSVQ